MVFVKDAVSSRIVYCLENQELREVKFDLRRPRVAIFTIGLVAIVVVVVVMSRSVVLRSTRPRAASRVENLDERLDQLRSVPYTHVTAEEVTDGRRGVVTYDMDRAHPGYNIFTVGLAPQVFLADMEGKIVHEWRYPQEQEGLWHHAIMLANGDLVVINEFHHVLRLDWHSNLIWKKEMLPHHDVIQLPDGTFYVIGVESWRYRGLVVRFPAIVHLNDAGEEIGRWSAHDHMDQIKQAMDQRSFLDTLLDSLLACKSWLEVYNEIADRDEAKVLDDSKVKYDQFHMNTLNLIPSTPLEKKDPRFEEGNLLVCFRNVNQIAVLDRDTKQVLWAWGEGHLEWPHHPTMLPNGNILIFDNGSRRKYSRVIELNPITGTIDWEYTGDPPSTFYSYGKGSAQRFVNGNTLICEGDRGRVFEVTPQGEIVWEWLNPTLKGKRRVQIYRMMRLEPDDVEPLLDRYGRL